MGRGGIVVWDCASCPARGVDFIPRLQRAAKTVFASVVVVAQDTRSLPAAVGDVAVAMPVTIRVGANATHDAVVDVIAHLSKCKGNCTVALVTNAFALWIALFQRLTPKGVVFVSGHDPRLCIEFGFLPVSLSPVVLGWPGLDPVVSGEDVEDDLLDLGSGLGGLRAGDDDVDAEGEAFGSPGGEEEEEEEGGSGDGGRVLGRSGPSGSAIQPLGNLDKYQIDLRSPVSRDASFASDGGDHTPTRGTTGREQTFEVPAKFRPLIESMRAIGKAMISLGDLETRLKAWCAKSGDVLEGVQSLVSRAADAQLVIYDKSIGYVRFRNRAMANGTIAYV